MSNDNKTLADVQPGGRVRLGDSLPPLPYPNYPVSKTGLQNNAYTASQMRDYALAALSAQPSPGGQGDAPPCWWIDHGTYGQITQRQDEADAAVNAGKRVISYAARQPVGDPVAYGVPDGNGGVKFGKGWASTKQAEQSLGATMPLFAAPPGGTE